MLASRGSVAEICEILELGLVRTNPLDGDRLEQRDGVGRGAALAPTGVNRQTPAVSAAAA